MIIPRFWARAEKKTTTPDGRSITAQKWHWSDQSEADARARAEERLETMLSRVHAGEPWPRRYDYGEDVPLREERIREIQLPGTSDAVITRNAYGALVLNVNNVMFVDIDTNHDDPMSPATAHRPHKTSDDEPATFSVQWFINLALEKLFGSTPPQPASQPSAPPPPPPSGGPDTGLAHVESWVAAHPGWAFRAYKTRSGYRLIATHALLQPDSPETLSTLQELHCDPVYIRLCKNQKSFRARLTPKPWRLGGFYDWRRISSPTHKYPYSAAARPDIESWIRTYDDASSGWATCHFIKSIGDAQPNSTAQTIVAIHDEHTKATSGLPLA